MMVDAALVAASVSLFGSLYAYQSIRKERAIYERDLRFLRDEIDRLTAALINERARTK